MVKILLNKKQQKIIYNIHQASNRWVVFFGGLMSDRKGTKALAFENFCKKNNFSYIRFDYLGHGDSDLDFTKCNINIWLENCLDIIDNLTEEKIIIIGSSLGGWLALLTGLKRPERIQGIITIAVAADFTEDLIWDILTTENKQKLQKGEIYNLPSEYCDGNYPITMDLIKSGRENFLLRNKKKINLKQKIRLFHGMQDEDVPYQYSIDVAQRLASKDVNLTLVKNGDHRMSNDSEIKLVCDAILELDK